MPYLEIIARKRVLDVTAGEFAELLAHKLKNPEKKEFVTKEDRNAILGALSDSRANKILKWGKDNGFPVKKHGRRYWNTSDLEKLFEAYTIAHS